MHAAESRPAPRRSAPPATPSPQPPASPPTACFHAPDPHRRSASPPVASRLLLAPAASALAPLNCDCTSRATTRAAPRRQNSQQPTSCNAVVLREDQRGGGGGRFPFSAWISVGVQCRCPRSELFPPRQRWGILASRVSFGFPAQTKTSRVEPSQLRLARANITS